AQPLALVVVGVVARVVIVVAHLQVVTLAESPVAFDQARRALHLAARHGPPPVADGVPLGEPGDRPRARAREDAEHLAVAERRVVEAAARADPPTRSDVRGACGPLLAGIVLARARRAVRERDLRRPAVAVEPELDAVIGRGHVDPGRLADERGVVLEAPAERQEELADLDRVAPGSGREQRER